jgi:hypothetical protein
MVAKKFAFYGGIAMVTVSLLSFIFVGDKSMLPPLKVMTSYGLFLGILPMNILNKLLLLGMGILGISSARRAEVGPSINYCRVVCVLASILTLLGIPNATDTLGGIIPLFGMQILTYGVIAMLSGYCGFSQKSTVEVVLGSNRRFGSVGGDKSHNRHISP